MTAMTVQAQDPRISAEESLTHDYPIGSEGSGEAGQGGNWVISRGHVYKRDEYRKDDSLDDAREVGPGESLTSPLLPGFTLAIDELFV